MIAIPIHQQPLRRERGVRVAVEYPRPRCDNAGMVIRGRVENGIVVLEKGVTLPEGTTVLVSPCAPAAEGAMDEQRHRAVMEEISRIASLPIEGATDPFSGSDHDRALYGKP